MNRIWAFFRRLFGHRDHTDVVPDPIVVPDPPPPTPVDPPVQPQAPFVTASGNALTLKGKPWVFVADTAWRLVEQLGQSPEDLAKYLDTRKAQGFNTIIIGTDGAWFSRSASKPVEALFSALDLVLAALESRGMLAILTCQMHQYDANGKPVLLMPRTDAAWVGKFFASRYGENTAIAMWMVGGLDDKGVVSSEDVMNIAEGIRAVDPSHLITFHPRANYTTVDAFPVSMNHQVALYQSYHSYAYATCSKKLDQMKATAAPFANIEGPFEGEPGVTAEDVIKVVNMSVKWPVCGVAYGHHLVWQFAKGWKEALDCEGVRGFLKTSRAYSHPIVGEPVVVTPTPTPIPTPVPNSSRLGQLHIYCESYDGAGKDSQLVKLGWPSDRVWIHVWDSATSWSKYGRRVLSIKNPYATGNNRWDRPMTDWRGAIDGFCRVAKASGCSAVSIDLEGWLIQTGPALVQHLYGAAHAVGLPVINVPKVGLEHLLVGRDDNWAWTRPPPRANMSAEQVCDHMNKYTDVDLQWYYGTRWQTFMEARDYLGKYGYKVPIVPMMDGAGRDGKQRIADAGAAAMVEPLYAAFGSIGIFNPHSLGPKFVAALRDIR